LVLQQLHIETFQVQGWRQGFFFAFLSKGSCQGSRRVEEVKFPRKDSERAERFQEIEANFGLGTDQSIFLGFSCLQHLITWRFVSFFLSLQFSRRNLADFPREWISPTGQGDDAPNLAWGIRSWENKPHFSVMVFCIPKSRLGSTWRAEWIDHAEYL
jgi:hypothetical protein